MRKHGFFLSSFLTVAAIALSLPPAQAQDDKELAQLSEKLIQAVNKKDIDTVASLLADDAVIIWQDGRISKGPKAVRDYLTKMLEGPDRAVDKVTIAPKAEKATALHDDITIVHGTSEDLWHLTDGRQLRLDTLWSATLVKKDGQWKIASCHLSVNMFDNAVLDVAVRRTLYWSAGAAVVIGIVLGFLGGRFLLRNRTVANETVRGSDGEETDSVTAHPT